VGGLSIWFVGFLCCFWVGVFCLYRLLCLYSVLEFWYFVFRNPESVVEKGYLNAVLG